MLSMPISSISACCSCRTFAVPPKMRYSHPFHVRECGFLLWLYFHLLLAFSGLMGNNQMPCAAMYPAPPDCCLLLPR
ncbi:hypothetical protein BDV10DRAFT_30173 [Aspergillus recurvatus]